jgi:hypothetical protein
MFAARCTGQCSDLYNNTASSNTLHDHFEVAGMKSAGIARRASESCTPCRGMYEGANGRSTNAIIVTSLLWPCMCLANGMQFDVYNLGTYNFDVQRGYIQCDIDNAICTNAILNATSQ